ncbi:hypothetical protein ACFYOK_03155 [Microbispora bryophytorum]|uniref:hypothetical protein n=1 Tax=Microbispora bryophytorum TaxID=1460882 RepID=UPI0033E99E40
MQRVAGNSGVIMVAKRKVAPGRIHARAIVTVDVSDTTLTIELPDDTRVVVRSREWRQTAALGDLRLHARRS